MICKLFNEKYNGLIIIMIHPFTKVTRCISVCPFVHLDNRWTESKNLYLLRAGGGFKFSIGDLYWVGGGRGTLLQNIL